MVHYTLGELIAVNLSHEYVYRYVPTANNIEDLMVAIDSNEEKLVHMQYIGKQDMFGNDIYEGDIMYKETNAPDDPAYGFYGSIGIVEEDVGEHGMGWYIKALDSYDRSFYDYKGINFLFSGIKIVGNIYENTDMIE